MELLLKCQDINKSYGNKHVLKNLNIEIEKGKIIGLLGPNGSGKSTFIKIVGGVLKRESGILQVDGNEIGIESKKIVSYLPERTYFSTSMKVSETLDFFRDFYQDFSYEKASDMLNHLEIPQNAYIKQLSKGTREKVQLVLVMSRDARLYLLDEPMGGVDPAARDYILKTILTNYNQNASILISTHLISDVEKVLDDIIFIKDGQAVLHESVDGIREKHGKSVDALFREVFKCY